MSNSIFPGGPVPRNTDRAEIALTKLLEIFLNAIDANGALKVTGAGLYFKDLADTPRTYDGQGGLFVRVNGSETGLEFTTIDGFIPVDEKGAADGVATLDSNSKLSESQIPTSVVLDSEKGVALGIATLGADGKLTSTQIPAGFLGAMRFMGFWDADANTTSPDLGSLVSGTPAELGQYWQVNVGGETALSEINDWVVGDWVVSLGSQWGKVDNTDTVISVAGRIGVIILTKADVGLDQVDNTSDSDKPVSSAQSTALSGKAPTNLVGTPYSFSVAYSTVTDAITAGEGKIIFPFPVGMTDITVWGGLGVVQTSGAIYTVDVNDSGTSILGTKLTIDNTEHTSLTADAQPTMVTTSIAKGAMVSIDVDQIGDGTAKSGFITFEGKLA